MSEDTRKAGQILKASELRIGDIVTLHQGNDGDASPFNHTIVRNIRTEDKYSKFQPVVLLSRPYAVLGDWITTAGIGVSLATEEYSVALDASTTFTLIRPTEAEKHARAVEAEREKLQHEIARLQSLVETRTKERDFNYATATQLNGQLQEANKLAEGLHADLNQRGEIIARLDKRVASVEEALTRARVMEQHLRTGICAALESRPKAATETGDCGR